MQILLTGSTGQIGWELQRALSDLGTVISPNQDTLDLADPDSIITVIRQFRPDLVINAAGYTAVDRAEQESDAAKQINSIAPGILAQQAAACNAAIIHFSTDYIFSGDATEPYQPSDEPNPINAYGRSKLLGEQNVRAANDESLVLRLSWVYGLRRRNFLRAILDQTNKRDQLSVVDDQIGCPTPCGLVAQWTAQIIEHSLRNNSKRWSFSGRAGTYHLACAGRTSWCGFARRIIELAELQRPVTVNAITTDDYPTPAKRPKQSCLNCDTTTDTFGINFTDWDTALQQVMAEYHQSTRTSPTASPAASTTNGM